MITDVKIKIDKENGDVRWIKEDRWVIICDTYGEAEYALFSNENYEPKFVDCFESFYEAVTAARRLF